MTIFLTRALRAGAALIAVFAAIPTLVSADTSAAAPAQATQLCNAELDSIATRNFHAFSADGTPQLKQITHKQFDAVCAQLTGPLKAGYTKTFVSQTAFLGNQVYTWRLTFKNASDGVVRAQLAVRDGKVSGFYLRPDVG